MAPLAMAIDNSGKLDAARALQAKLESAKLNIVEDQTRFDTLQSTLAKDPGLIAEGVAGTTDPAIVAAEEIYCEAHEWESNHSSHNGAHNGADWREVMLRWRGSGSRGVHRGSSDCDTTGSRGDVYIH